MSTPALDSGRSNQKRRTWRLLLDTAAGLLAKGEQPSIEQVADAAGVSRRTAYRYFPTQQKLHAEAALDRLRPAMEQAINTVPDAPDVESRVLALIGKMQLLVGENESLLRTMIHETVLKPPRTGESSRGRRRLEWIESSLTPIQGQIAEESHRRLVCALALCTGIEAVLVLRDICGLPLAEATAVSQWVGLTLVRQVIRERNAARRAGPPKQAKRRART
jgi:AcrR family transcriptional regulator